MIATRGGIGERARMQHGPRREVRTDVGRRVEQHPVPGVGPRVGPDGDALLSAGDGGERAGADAATVVAPAVPLREASARRRS